MLGIFNTDRITTTPYAASIMYVLLSVLLWVLSPPLFGTVAWPAHVLFGLLLALSIGYMVFIFLRLEHRARHVQQFADKHGLRYLAKYSAHFLGALGIVNRVPGAKNQRIINVVTNEDWAYGDFSYSLQARLYSKGSGSADFETMTVHYGIMSVPLPRKLPNVFFDSSRVHGRQFRFQLGSAQRHGLEGDFDTFFDTYFPEDYTIDSMSFISPEVMWQLRAAADYDIEIYGERLFLYGALDQPERQIPDMTEKAMAIRQALLHNIVTYRDERLPYDEGRKAVTVQGATLRTGQTRSVTIIGVTVVVYLLIWLRSRV